MTRLATLDFVVIGAYLAVVVGIGWVMRRSARTAADFFRAGRSLPGWIAGVALASASVGAVEVLAMGAYGARYGMVASHFYWIGAIPALVFVALFMVPVYYGSKVRSLPEYLRLRYDEKTRVVVAASFAAMTVVLSGVSLFALGRVLNVLVGWSFDASVLIFAAVVLTYVLAGGLKGVVYNQLLQFALVVLVLGPLTWMGVRSVDGWSGLQMRLSQFAMWSGLPSGAYTDVWKGIGSAGTNPMGVEWAGLAMGLGAVLSFSYWGTDFRILQRALAAESMIAARRAPLIAGLIVAVLPFFVIVPGMVALMLGAGGGPALGGVNQGIIPAKLSATGAPMVDALGRTVLDYDMATPMLLVQLFPTGFLGLGIAALIASLMAGLAANLTAFNTVWTYDIHAREIPAEASDGRYLTIGRAATVGGTVASVIAAYAATAFNSIIEVLQLLFAFVNAPLFVTFALGMFWKRATGHGAFWGLVAGIAAAALHHGLTIATGTRRGVAGGFLGLVHRYPSELAQTLWTAIIAFCACAVVTILVSLVTRPRPEGELRGLIFSRATHAVGSEGLWLQRPAILSCAVLSLALALNLVFF